MTHFILYRNICSFLLGYGRANVTCLNHCNLDHIGYCQLSTSSDTAHAHAYTLYIVDTFFLLVQRIGDIFVVTFIQNGDSALMIACSRGDNAIVQLLLNNNANVNLQALVRLHTDFHSHGTYFCTTFLFN